MQKYKVLIEETNNRTKIVYVLNNDYKMEVFETNLVSVCGLFCSFVEESQVNDIDKLIEKAVLLIEETLSYKKIDEVYFKSLISHIVIDNRNGFEYDYKHMFLINWRITQLLNIGLKDYEEYLINKPIFLSEKFIKEINTYKR